MSCEDVRALISQAADDELCDGDAHAGLAEHLRGCASCRDFERYVRELRAELRIESVEVAPDIASGVLAAIHGSHQPQPPISRRGIPDADPSGVVGLTSSRRQPNRRVSVTIAAAVVAGALAGAAVVALGVHPPSSPAADIGSDPGLDVLLAWTPGRLDPGLEAAASSVTGVRATSAVYGAVVDLVASRDADGSPVDVLDAGWAIPLDAIAVPPNAHAEFASVLDRPAVARLAPDEALLSETSARLRDLSAGATLELEGGHQLRVAAIVADTTIGAAELAVDRATGERIGIDMRRYLLVAYDGDRGVVESALRDAVSPERALRIRAPDETPFLRNGDAVLPPARLKERFGEFSYRPPPAGRRVFDQDLTWQAEHLAERDLPLLGRVRCHKDILDALEAALRELQARGLEELIDPHGFAGCWNPRLVAPGGGLSHHAWGVAFDINYDDNPTGQPSTQDPRLVEVFEQWGFTSGDGWLIPDPAHFEYVRPPKTLRLAI